MPRFVMIDYDEKRGPKFRQAAEGDKKIIREPTSIALVKSLAELAEIPLEDGDCLRMKITIATAKTKLIGFKLRPSVLNRFRATIRCLDCGSKFTQIIKVVTFVKNGVSKALMAASVACAFSRIKEGRDINGSYANSRPYHRHRKTTVTGPDCTCPHCHSFHVTPTHIGVR